MVELLIMVAFGRVGKFIVIVIAAVGLGVSSAALALGQTQPTTTTVTQAPTTVTKTVQHADGTYTVIEYPVGKEVKLTLNAVTLTGSTGVATVLRDDNGTRVVLNLTGVPADVGGMNLYAIDPAGVVTSLGPITISNGVGILTATTPLNRFMLVVGPNALTLYDANTRVFFRSAVPVGFAVIPHATSPVGEKVGATTIYGTKYSVPLLNIPEYKKGDDPKFRVNYIGAMSGARTTVFITPLKNGSTEIKLRFHELKDAPAGKVFTVWAISPDETFVKLGQILNAAALHEAEVKSEVALRDFGLLVTMEDATGTLVNPVGPTIAVVESALASARLPEFPWPPQASAYTRIPSQYVLNPNGKTLLKAVGGRLERAFESAGYGQTGYYSVPGGFALASQLEQFKPNGLPSDDPYRWTERIEIPSVFSTEYLSTLIKGKIGRYRVIVFVVSNDYFSQNSGKVVEVGAAKVLAIRGASALPVEVGDLPYTDKHTCTALVYEFEKAVLDKPAQFKDNSTLPAETHLKKLLADLRR